MRVIYAIGAKFAGGGFGTTAYHGARTIHAHGMLRRLLCGAYRPTEIPSDLIRAFGLPDQVLRKLATYDRSHWMAHLQTMVFDAWAARRLESADVLLVWYKCGLRSMQRAQAMGMVTVGQWGNVHPRQQYDVLAEEYARWGLQRRMPRAVLARALAEIQRADYLICPTEQVRFSFGAEGVPETKLITIPNGVDLDHFRPAADLPARPFRVLFVGQIGFRKGVPYLLQAWQRLGWRDAELCLAGNVDAEMRPLLARFADLPGLRLLGYRADPVTLYQSAHVFAFPSLLEGSAKVNFEALACGLPVVVTANAGSVARDGVEGCIVPARDPDGLAAALERLRGDDRRRRDMRTAARARAAEFPWRRHGEAVVEALGAAVQRGAPT
jgi:glycosyltransferase involved in cell wall biosynthesis